MAKVYNANLENLDGLSCLAGSSCAFGVFDGLHKGHVSLVEHAVAVAQEAGTASVVLTFSIDPDELFTGERLRKLMPNSRRIEALAQLGVDYVVVLPFTRAFAALAPEDFLGTVFAQPPAVLHVGRDFRFGNKAAGTVATLEEWGGAHGMRVCAHSLVEVGGAPVTATRIRALLAQGAIQEANELLSTPYSWEGTVEQGRQQGRDLGFRTANLNIPTPLFALGEGVYGAYAHTPQGRYKAAVSVGAAPTFEDATATCEVHIIDFEGDLYGSTLRVEFRHWLRAMRKFSSIDELVETVMGNIQWCRDNL